jgi:hypothetical protein
MSASTAERFKFIHCQTEMDTEMCGLLGEISGLIKEKGSVPEPVDPKLIGFQDPNT